MSMLSLSHAALPKRQWTEHKSLFFALSGGSPFARTPILRKQKELMKSTAWGKFGKNDVCCLTGGDRLTIDREKKAIFVNHVEIMKLGNLVPNFDSTSGHLISLRTGHRIDIIKHRRKVKLVGCLFPAGMYDILESRLQMSYSKLLVLISETTSFKTNFSKFILLLLDHNRSTRELLRSVCNCWLDLDVVVSQRRCAPLYDHDARKFLTGILRLFRRITHTEWKSVPRFILPASLWGLRPG